MSDYYDDDELDIRVRRGRASPGIPVVYPEHRYRPAPRPYYETPSTYLVPAINSGRARSRSTGGRSEAAPAPVIINNRIYNDYEDDDYMGLAPPRRERSRSRSRPSSFIARDEYELEKTRRELEAYKLVNTREDYELERTRKELEALRHEKEREEDEKRYKNKRELDALRREKEREEDEKRYKNKRELEAYVSRKELTEEEERLKDKRELEHYKAEKEHAEEEKRIKKELELKRLQEERKAEEEKARIKKESDAAIEKYKREQAEKEAKEKKEKEEREKEYQHRLEDDLRKSGMDERQIAVVLKKDKGVDPSRPTYTRMSRRHLSIETLNRYRIDYEFDQDPDYILIKRWVPEYEQDFLWSHTREIRERRQPVLFIEGSKKKHQETEFELVRKKKHERKPSPSPLLTFLAGGKPR